MMVDRMAGAKDAVVASSSRAAPPAPPPAAARHPISGDAPIMSPASHRSWDGRAPSVIMSPAASSHASLHSPPHSLIASPVSLRSYTPPPAPHPSPAPSTPSSGVSSVSSSVSVATSYSNHSVPHSHRSHMSQGSNGVGSSLPVTPSQPRDLGSRTHAHAHTNAQGVVRGGGGGLAKPSTDARHVSSKGGTRNATPASSIFVRGIRAVSLAAGVYYGMSLFHTVDEQGRQVRVFKDDTRAYTSAVVCIASYVTL